MPPLVVWLVLALLLVGGLVTLRLFLARPPQRVAGYTGPLVSTSRAALMELLEDPHSAAGRAAELRGDWTVACAEYSKALENVMSEDPSAPGAALKRRTLESKLEELERLREAPPVEEAG